MNEKELAQRIEELEKSILILKNKVENHKGFRVWGFSRLSTVTGVIVVMLFAATVLYAAQIFFNDGDLISADEVNSNFTELYNKVNADAGIQTVSTNAMGRASVSFTAGAFTVAPSKVAAVARFSNGTSGQAGEVGVSSFLSTGFTIEVKDGTGTPYTGSVQVTYVAIQ
jgi:hypothetical protein